MPNSASRLPPFAAKPRPVVTQAVRSASGYAVATTQHSESKPTSIKQAGPKPRFAPAETAPDAA